MTDKLEIIDERFSEIGEMLTQPDTVNDTAKYTELMKEYSRLEPICQKYGEYKRAAAENAEARELLKEGGIDEEMHEMVSEQLNTSAGDMERLSEELKIMLLPKDPNDEKNVIVEIRGGAGGQHINKTESAVRITHLPTGLVVECQDERSQYKNKDKAMRVLRSRLLEMKQAEHDGEIAAKRRSMVGTGDRSERIRTYNFPESRVSDHRIGLTLYKLDSILNGSLDEVIDALALADRTAQLANEK